MYPLASEKYGIKEQNKEKMIFYINFMDKNPFQFGNIAKRIQN